MHLAFKTMNEENNEISNLINMIFKNVRIDSRFKLSDLEIIFPPINFYQRLIQHFNGLVHRFLKINRKN